MKKEIEIRKIKIKTYRNQQTLKKKDEELKRSKKITEALKLFVKPTNAGRSSKRDSSSQPHEMT